MKVGRPSRGFTLLEMIVNLALLSALLLCIVAMVRWTSGTMKDTAGKLVAAEKSEQIRHALATDLAALPADAEDALTCKNSATEWTLELRVPKSSGGWSEVSYHWSKEKGSIVRAVRNADERVSRVIGTGFSEVTTRWLANSSEDREKARRSWGSNKLPGLLDLNLETTRLREEGKREDLDEAHVASSGFHFLLPVGGGPVER